MDRYVRWTTTITALLVAAASLQCAKTQTIAPVKADIIVDANGSTDYESISDALDDAEDGYVILVRPGTYEEEVEFDDDKENITLLGSGPGKTIIDADGEYAVVTMRGTGHRISGFTLRGGESHGVYVPDGKHRVDQCLIVGNGDRGIYLSTMSGRGRAKIDHCTIVDSKVSGIYAVKDDAETAITNCIIASNGRGIVSDKDEGNMRIDYNCLDNSSDNFDRVSEGKGNIERDPKFVDSDDGNYRLKKNSPCVGAASDGSDMGCF